MPATFTLAGWLTAARPLVGGRLAGITAKTLVDNNSDILEEFPRGEKRDASSAWIVLAAIAELDLPAPWIGHFDWKDGDAWGEELPPMVGLSKAPTAESFAELVGKCNARATNGVQLYSVVTGGDNYVVIAVPPEQSAALVAAELVELDETIGHVEQKRSLGARILGWFGRTR